MLLAKDIFHQIQRLTIDLISTGLCDDQNFPNITRLSQGIEIVDIHGRNTSICLKNIPYSELYLTLNALKSYNIKLLDGALVSLQYTFCNNALVSHRLSFFPSPDLQEFQNNPDMYIEDEIYAEILDKRVVTFPIRFDYCYFTDEEKPRDHPLSHLTLGQYENCRIPVSAPITPNQFLSFIIINFYNTASRIYYDQLSSFTDFFSETISKAEKRVMHMQLPL